jgi:hypothetical protein
MHAVTRDRSRTPQHDRPEERLSLESIGLVETTGSKIRDLEQATELVSELVLGHDGDGKLGLFGGAERQKQQKTPRPRVPLERVQERVEVVSACQVVAPAIDEHIEGLSDPAYLGHVSSDEASASSGRMIGRASLGFLNRGRGEIHADDLESVRREEESLDATPTAEVESGSTRR